MATQLTWRHEHGEAPASVHRGLQQARTRQLAMPAPGLEAQAESARRLQEG